MAPTRSPPKPSLTQTTLKDAFTRSSVLTTSNNANRVAKKQSPAKSKSNANSSSSSASENDKTDVLMAIKPVHMANIASRQKNHEYRKYRLRDGVTRLWFYETGDGGKGRASITYVFPGHFTRSLFLYFSHLYLGIVRHVAVIPESTRHTPGSVPIEPFGIGNEDFNAGLKQSKYGYPIVELYELVRPVTLKEMKDQWGMGAPMGWQYVPPHLWEDRWGKDEDREDKVKKLF
ncbi:uncharacterized protein N7483_003639 [Penicillium malachiteum]|uniref:uncharacterized protein n=1 Tax=Penicillium malachiteum TaxID=1324776 RepID=UPI0025479374|nr:uncharacterized protein N7483_003639 [Penicillium malachiteum]KAJ5729131.1 hypothetical protein N7483_003639 [Penicillium malachiteum]